MNVLVEQTASPIVAVGKVRFGNKLPHALEMASALRAIAEKLEIGLVYKTSFDKANRTSAKSKRGIGLDRALPIFAEIRETIGTPILTDVHASAKCARIA